MFNLLEKECGLSSDFRLGSTEMQLCENSQIKSSWFQEVLDSNLNQNLVSGNQGVAGGMREAAVSMLHGSLGKSHGRKESPV